MSHIGIMAKPTSDIELSPADLVKSSSASKSVLVPRIIERITGSRSSGLIVSVVILFWLL